MKRDALCDKCTKSIKKHSGWWQQDEAEYPTYLRTDRGERHVLKVGWAINAFTCDLCDNHVKEKEDCGMRSIYKNADEYYSWESEMITKATSFTDLLKTI